MNIVPITPVKQFMATLLAIGMFMGCPFLARADDYSNQVININGDIYGGGILGDEGSNTTTHITVPLGSLE
ncbi:MAG: hypothetical protein LBN28_06145, partial [Desulfovibrio sp.]|nr:hypothetical protein [Desulfovibrio sp.]